MITQPDHGSELTLSDNSLSEHFGVSRITVRKAIQELVDEGLLYRVQGVGTFVRPHKITEKLTLNSFLEPWVGGKGRLEVRVGEFTKIAADAELAAKLKIEPGTKVIYVQRLRLKGGVQVAIDNRYIKANICNHLTIQQIMNSSLVDYLKNRENVELKHGVMDIEAKAADSSEASQLGVRKGHPLLVRSVTFFTRNDLPVLTGKSLYRADLIRYRVTLFNEATI